MQCLYCHQKENICEKLVKKTPLFTVNVKTIGNGKKIRKIGITNLANSSDKKNILFHRCPDKS